MKIFRSDQIRAIDEATIQNEPIHGVDLMERAAGKLHDFIAYYYPENTGFYIVAGPGNNGGDAVALARMLAKESRMVRLVVLDFTKNVSDDCKTNLERIHKYDNVQVDYISTIHQMPSLNPTAIIVDGIFGSGLTRPVNGFPADVIQFINKSPNTVFSIDIPSGLFSETNQENDGEIIKADITVSFQFPKLAFFMPENDQYVGQWFVESIGLCPDTIDKSKTDYYFQTLLDVPKLMERGRFAHKGDFGHALLVAGSYGKTGAAVLAAKAALRSGLGLLSVHVPQSAYSILQSSVPEAMVEIDETEQLYCTKQELSKYNAIGIGPGIGKKKSMADAMEQTLRNTDVPMVLDADALNIISEHKHYLDLIPKESILTPHPKEFDRLTGKHSWHLKRIESARTLAKKHKIIIVLKGANTAVVHWNGTVVFNSTGNPSMAKGGSGDALTGIILGLLSSGYPPYDAALLGVFVHGLSADLLLDQYSIESVIATDIIENLPNAFNELRNL